MFHYTFSTILMMVVATNLLVILLTLCFRNTKIMINAGYKLLALFILFVVLRFLLPFELPFAIPLYWSDVVSLIIWKLYLPLGTVAGHPVSVWIIFKWCWIIGIFINLALYIASHLKARHNIVLHAKVITSREPFHKLMNRICAEWKKPNKFALIELPDLKVPVLYGILRPAILIPEEMDLSENDWYYVLKHEVSHHFHRDILMKNIIKLITIIYWWNPFCMILNRQADVILEMRVDDVLTVGDHSLTESYLQCLIHVSENAVNPKYLSKYFTMSLLPTANSDIKKRFRMLIANQSKKNLSINLFLLAVVFAIYILSYVFVLEAYHAPEKIEMKIFPNDTYDEMIFTEDNAEFYAIQNDEGTYDIFLGGIYCETVDSLEFYPPDIPIYTREDFPE